MNPRRESRDESYDVVVIGSGIGIGGLSAAALLARAGRKVLIVERHDRPGGYAHGFQRRRYRFDSAVHATSGGEPVGFGTGDLIDQTLRALGVRDAVTFVPTDNFYTAIFLGLRIDVPVGLEPFLDEHVEHFPEAGPGLRRLLRLCTWFNRESRKLPADATAADPEARSAEFPLHTRPEHKLRSCCSGSLTSTPCSRRSRRSRRSRIRDRWPDTSTTIVRVSRWIRGSEEFRWHWWIRRVF